MGGNNVKNDDENDQPSLSLQRMGRRSVDTKNYDSLDPWQIFQNELINIFGQPKSLKQRIRLLVPRFISHLGIRTINNTRFSRERISKTRFGSPVLLIRPNKQIRMTLGSTVRVALHNLDSILYFCDVREFQARP